MKNIERVGSMNIETNRSVLIERQANLHNDVIAIQNELDILQALLKKAEEELVEIQIKLGELEGSSTIKLAYAS